MKTNSLIGRLKKGSQKNENKYGDNEDDALRRKSHKQVVEVAFQGCGKKHWQRH